MGAARLSPDSLSTAGGTRLSPTLLLIREVALSLGDTGGGDSDTETERVWARATSPLGDINAGPPQTGLRDPKNLTRDTPRPSALYWREDNK